MTAPHECGNIPEYRWYHGQSFALFCYGKTERFFVALFAKYGKENSLCIRNYRKCTIRGRWDSSSAHQKASAAWSSTSSRYSPLKIHGTDTGVSFGLLFHKLFVPSGGVSPLYFLRNYGVLLVVSILCCTPLIEKIWNLLKKNAVTRCAAILALLVVSTAYVVGSTNSPFLYFNF